VRGLDLEPVPLPPLPAEPLVSVVIPNHNYGRFLSEALESVLTQAWPRLEVVVCDDASTDGSPEIVESARERDARVSLVTTMGSRGQAAALNQALQASHGEVICFLDADDTFLPGKVEAVIRSFRQEGAGMVVHPLVMVDVGGTEIQRIPSLSRVESGWLGPRVIARGGRWRWVPASGVSLRREVADLVFPLPEEPFPTSADTFFLMLAPLLTSVLYLDRVLARYRRHGENAYARSRIEAARAATSMQNLLLALDEVNTRLVALGITGSKLDIEDNLRYQELRFQLGLLEAAPRWPRLAREYLGLMMAVGRDDLYRAVQKAWAWGLYGIAILLPARYRAAWLSLSLSASSRKDLARRLFAPGPRERR
jgi:glycosyltransferase involved in cell wall biosynthesis